METLTAITDALAEIALIAMMLCGIVIVTVPTILGVLLMIKSYRRRIELDAKYHAQLMDKSVHISLKESLLETMQESARIN